MTPNPECATLETTILDALHIMHDRKFLHIPVLDKGELCFSSFQSEKETLELTFFADGSASACVDVLQITHAAISMVRTIIIKCIIALFFLL